MNTEEKVAKVTALADELKLLSTDEIAERIRQAEVGKGEQGTASKCPLALLFAKVVGFEVWVTAARWNLPDFNENGGIEEWAAQGEMPNSCAVFIDRIDDGHREYADLVEHMSYSGDDIDGTEFTDYEYPLSPNEGTDPEDWL